MDACIIKVWVKMFVSCYYETRFSRRMKIYITSKQIEVITANVLNHKESMLGL